MVWNKTEILDEIRRQHKKGADLSYNELSAKMQSLVSAAAYHFGSYRRAVELAGIEYSTVLRRPRWTKARIIALIKSARRRGEELHWSAVTHRRDELGKAAFASLQPRLFGKWQRALHAAGLDAEDIARYRRWDRPSIAYELKSRARDGEPVSSGAPGPRPRPARRRRPPFRRLRFRPSRRRTRSPEIPPPPPLDKKSVLKSIKVAAKSGDNLADSRVRITIPR